MKLTPLSDNIVVELIKEEEKTKSGILLPQNSEREKSNHGLVIEVGPGKMTSSGKLIPMEVKKGDKIIYGKFGHHEIKIGDKEYLILRQEEVLAVVE
ncbi:co-chaperone GroES [bacterium]|jgi:chaperonin GroES|nr:co-chaperone GroES [bacterium]